MIASNCLNSILAILETHNVDVFGLKMQSTHVREFKDAGQIEVSFCETNANSVNFMTSASGTGGGVCTQIYKTELLKRHNIQFVPKIKYSEDVLFSFKAVMKAQVCAKTDSVLYYYYQRPGSAMHSGNYNAHIESMHRLAHEYQKIANEEPEMREVALSKKYQAVKALLFSLVQKGDIKFAKSKIKELKEEGLYPYPFLKKSLRNNATKKQALINYLSFLFPWKWYVMFSVRIVSFKNKFKRKNK